MAACSLIRKGADVGCDGLASTWLPAEDIFVMCDPLREFNVVKNVPELTDSSIFSTTDADDRPLDVTTSYMTSTSERSFLPLIIAEYPETAALTFSIIDAVSPRDLMK